jgi:hypothetical protein
MACRISLFIIMRKYLLFALLLISVYAQAQQLQLLQERNYKTDALEKQIYTSAPALQGNILFSGSALKSSHNYENSFLLVKPNADTLWTRKGPTGLKLYPQALRQTADGGFIFCGTSKHPTIGAISGLLMQKINSNGLPLWSQNNYFNNSENIPAAVLVMPNKDFLIGGFIKGNGFSLLRTDSLGNTRWLKDYNWSSDDALVDMQFTKKGKIITAGISNIPVGLSHLKLMVFNQNGDSLKGKQINVNGPNRSESMYSAFSSVTPLSDGGYLLTANLDTVTSSFPNGIAMGMVVKVDSSLNLVWKYIHRTPAVDEYVFTKAKELADGSVIVLGFKFRPAQGGNGFQLYRFNAQGVLKNVYPFTSSICTQTWGVTLDALPDSTFMIGGRCGNNPPVTYGFYVAKVKIPGLPAVLPPIMPGTVTGLAAEQSKPESYLGQSYPNPTTSTAIIPYSLPVSSKQAQIIVRDITGREVGKYELKKNSSNLEVNLSNLHNGLYTYTLVADGKPVATKKLAVMK